MDGNSIVILDDIAFEIGRQVIGNMLNAVKYSTSLNDILSYKSFPFVCKSWFRAAKKCIEFLPLGDSVIFYQNVRSKNDIDHINYMFIRYCQALYFFRLSDIFWNPRPFSHKFYTVSVASTNEIVFVYKLCPYEKISYKLEITMGFSYENFEGRYSVISIKGGSGDNIATISHMDNGYEDFVVFRRQEYDNFEAAGMRKIIYSLFTLYFDKSGQMHRYLNEKWPNYLSFFDTSSCFTAAEIYNFLQEKYDYFNVDSHVIK